MSYVQQIPWIRNCKIRENILFELPYEKEKYERTIEVCELTRDLGILPAGDQTEIGEKGINLSGGQKARLSLARAVYADKEMILMDDPISALDANVKKNIFNKVFQGELKNKTRVLVTHAVDFLHLADYVVMLKDGKIILKGTFDELKDQPEIKELKKIHNAHKQEIQEVKDEAKEGNTQDEKKKNEKENKKNVF